MSPLVGRDLGIDPFLVAQTCLGSTKNLKGNPAEADFVELVMKIPPQKIIAGKKRTPVRRQNLNEIDSAFLRSHIFRGIIWGKLRFRSKLVFERFIALCLPQKWILTGPRSLLLQCTDRFRQPAANRSDDASRRFSQMKSD